MTDEIVSDREPRAEANEAEAPRYNAQCAGRGLQGGSVWPGQSATGAISRAYARNAWGSLLIAAHAHAARRRQCGCKG
jgi:hypothetical protein